MLTILIGLTDDWTEALKHFQSILRDREREIDANDKLSLVVENSDLMMKAGGGGRVAWDAEQLKP